jgi:lipopolysaccharide export system permease protein
MMGFFLYKIPLIVLQMTPVAALIAVIIMFSLMRKANEITALKACGLSVLRVSLPVLLTSLCLAGGTFLFSELVVPYSSSKSQSIWQKEVDHDVQERFYGRTDLWYKGKHAIYWVRHYQGKRMIMEDPTLYFFDDAFHLTKKISARQALWKGTFWRAEDGFIQTAQKDGSYRFERFRELALKLPEKPETFLRTFKEPEEMSFWQLKRFALRTQQEGYDATRYLVDMHVKIAFPFIVLTLVLLGIPISLSIKMGGVPLAVCFGTGVCFLYLLTFGLSRSLGLSGVLPPMLAAWIANFAFFLVGSYLILHLET